MKLRALTMALAMTVLIAGAAAPRRAEAIDNKAKVGLITGGVITGLLLVAIIGTALTRDDPRFLREEAAGLPTNPLDSKRRLHFGTACPQGGAATVAVCW